MKVFNWGGLVWTLLLAALMYRIPAWFPTSTFWVFVVMVVLFAFATFMLFISESLTLFGKVLHGIFLVVMAGGSFSYDDAVTRSIAAAEYDFVEEYAESHPEQRDDILNRISIRKKQQAIERKEVIAKNPETVKHIERLAMSNEPEKLSALLGADGKIKDEYNLIYTLSPFGNVDGKKPIVYIAAKYDADKNVKWLLDHGATPFAKVDGTTYDAIHEAAYLRNDKLLKLFRDAGYEEQVDIEVTRQAKIKAEKIAKFGYDVDIRELLSNPFKYDGLKIDPGPLRIAEIDTQRGSFQTYRSKSGGLYGSKIGDETIEVFYTNMPDKEKWQFLEFERLETKINVTGKFMVYGSGKGGYILADKIEVD